MTECFDSFIKLVGILRPKMVCVCSSGFRDKYRVFVLMDGEDIWSIQVGEEQASCLSNELQRRKVPLIDTDSLYEVPDWVDC